MKSVAICGSRRFRPEIRAFAANLKAAGAVVYEPYLHDDPTGWAALGEAYRRYVALGLTHDHFYKIATADVVYVYNQDGYAGVSTTLEMGYAVAAGKPIYARCPDQEELCRHVLIREIVPTLEGLLERLQ